MNETNTDILTPREASILAFLKAGYNRTRACQMAGVNRTLFYKWLQYDEFHEAVLSAEAYIDEKAFKNVTDAIGDGDLDTSKWYLQQSGYFADKKGNGSKGNKSSGDRRVVKVVQKEHISQTTREENNNAIINTD